MVFMWFRVWARCRAVASRLQARRGAGPFAREGALGREDMLWAVSRLRKTSSCGIRRSVLTPGRATRGARSNARARCACLCIGFPPFGYFWTVSNLCSTKEPPPPRCAALCFLYLPSCFNFPFGAFRVSRHFIWVVGESEFRRVGPGRPRVGPGRPRVGPGRSRVGSR